MPLDAQEFATAFSRARERLGDDPSGDVTAEQDRLRALVPADSSDEDKRWTGVLIDRLAEPQPPPRQRGPLYDQAAEIHASAFAANGSRDEQIAAARDARRRIFAIAAQADEDDAADIRAMTRPLEHWENELRDPPWPVEGPRGQGS
ncbi:hypothetical protein [Kribbella italica]|uniref:Uncharacterized protein n=1 Tax=Kribbella italica TaxID=1540520 RepID=A0A7W9J6G8_9ACTN|nr:hypothetical protein [Kribbella italica]MBB5836482.1 hypothetical protein [Kribbella italica]